MGMRIPMEIPHDRRRRHLTRRMISAPALRAGALTITPTARLTVATWRGAGVVWMRPWTVVVSEEGRTSRLRIFNLTRVTHLTIGVLAALAVLWMITRS